MAWIALTLLAMAIALWRYGRPPTDDVGQFLGLAAALICLLGGLVASPWPLKILVLTGLLLYPACPPTDRQLKPDCPGLCLLRRQCRGSTRPPRC